MVKAGGVHTETAPPVYNTVTEQVLVREGYTVWRPGSTVAGYSANSYGSGYAAPPPSAYAGTGAMPNPAYGNFPTRVLATGEVLCLVQVPPEPEGPYRSRVTPISRSRGSGRRVG